MYTALKAAGAITVMLGIAACNSTGGSSTLPAANGASALRAPSAREAKLWGPNAFAACAHPRNGSAQCGALIGLGRTKVPSGGSGPNGGYAPAQLQEAYNLPSATKGTGQIVAVVDAYDNPDVASDLGFYRSYFGLPAASFTKFNQYGQIGSYPQGDTGWGAEEDLDVEMVSASCPNCTIYLVEANSEAISDLQSAEEEAVTLGAHIVTNSFGMFPDLGCSPCFDASAFDAPGVTYLASGGDFGYGVGMPEPASFDSVVSVGGTSLYVDRKSKRGFSEKAWLGTGSGCATQVAKPSWQEDFGCKYRVANDVAALADLATGPAFYDTYSFNGWLIGGGTSTGTPLLAGIFALAGNASSQHGGKTFWEKIHQGADDLFHIEKGHNGTCSPTYLCTDGTHEYRDYGGPTGWGTPNGIGAF
jgi:subtilase family serine protease